MSARTLHPSDVVVWKHTDHDRSTLRKLGPATRFVDRQDEYNTAGLFVARYLYTGDKPYADPDERAWRLLTQGAATGGRRYRDMLTLAEAQSIALAWLDRRFAAVDAVTGEPVKA